jgi:hypothetical protein
MENALAKTERMCSCKIKKPLSRNEKSAKLKWKIHSIKWKIRSEKWKIRSVGMEIPIGRNEKSVWLKWKML